MTTRQNTLFNDAVTTGRALGFVAACVAAVFVFTMAVAQANDHGVRIYVTGESASPGYPGSAPATDFDCGDTVYAVLESSSLPEESHSVVVQWTDPNGKERERTDYDFTVRSERTRVWSWLRLHRGAGSSLLSIFDQSAGMGDFIGTWVVAVTLNDRRIGTTEFTVLC